MASSRVRSSLRLRSGKIIRFPAVMGILNVTPDSFSDGGEFLDPKRALEHALEMEAQGADIIDIGGESSRPGAHAVPESVELERVMPVLEGLRGKLRVPVSVDTRKAAIASAALAAGAEIVNDVSGLTFDPLMASTAARAGAAMVVMHMAGTPETMMHRAHYDDLIVEVCRFLSRQARIAIQAGVAPSRVIIDPGFGFAKTAQHNLQILVGLHRICALGYPVLVGASRKSFVRKFAGADRDNLLFGTAAVNALAIAAGAAIVRVHDPGPACAVVRMAAAVSACSRR